MHFSTYTLLAPTVLISLSQAKNIDIIVGKSGLTFEPNSTTADEGDTLTFKFWPKAHSVVQGAFDSPCTPIDTGFNSDFVPVESGAANRTFVVTVNNTNPIWYYCSQGKHCQNGMVGVINPPSNNRSRTLAAYSSAAADVSEAETPDSVRGGVFESSSSSSSSGSSSSSTPSGSAATPASSTGAGVSLVGQGAAGVAGLVAVVAGLWGL
ncbi:putative extracellular serine-rich protein [Lasiodiplodia theobromae]|uniref:GPI-anchored cupredoxin-1 n=2 Tax=Lasiodiplodia TaxID=66739 RepID=A0AA39Z0K1_9PEZI|nr:putative GPI-anchored cupredoxin [Lasiodiplodia theobromae]KAF9639645.1 putative extracellular serine-rich protein [Lasiodiplodia theobromae]KAK0661993.1 putative GPI-anchored cupredoxin-1 [Lasiodiplodia hormozganensis]